MTSIEAPSRRTPEAADSRESWATDLAGMGLTFSADGNHVTVTSRVMPSMFGRPAAHHFALTMSSTNLLRLRHLLTGEDEVLHLPVHGHVVTHEHQQRSTTRLIATSAPVAHCRLRLEVTTWVTSPDGAETWLDTYFLDNLTAPDVAHFDTVRAMWTAGITPRSAAPRYLAAGFSVREAVHLQSTLPRAERDTRIDLLTALRAE